MKKKDYETYLGDTICSIVKNEKNIANKCNMGVGAVSQIFAMVSQVSLRHYYFDLALIMRRTILISKLVSSSETWYNVTKPEYQKLESIDEMCVRSVLNAQASTPK